MNNLISAHHSGVHVVLILLFIISLIHPSGAVAQSSNFGANTVTGAGIWYSGTNVGIGTSATNGARLTVEGASGFWNIRLRNSEPGSIEWLLGSASNDWGAGGGKFVISNSNLSADASLVIDASRNIGIGKVNPAYKLDVNGTANVSVLYAGVTTAPAGYKLAVGGKAIAEEVVIKLQTSWPDYVFEKNYKLPPLLEVERYIREHKHLPGVPSAEEVQDQGLSVGEMNAVLLKKVEELTLYVIELKKEVEALKAAGEKR
jgi:hypothetical protein